MLLAAMHPTVVSQMDLGTFATVTVAIHCGVQVLLAAVLAAVVSQTGLGSAPAFRVPDYKLASPLELPLFLLFGAMCGGVSAVFTYTTKVTSVDIYPVRLLSLTDFPCSCCSAPCAVACTPSSPTQPRWIPAVFAQIDTFNLSEGRKCLSCVAEC